VALWLAALPSHGHAAAWVTNGPEGGWIRGLAIDPTTSNTMYTTVESGGIWKTTSGGAS